MNLKRHKLLKFLTKETLKNELNKNETGVDYSLIYDFLKCNKIEYLEITTTLFNNNEIQRYYVGNKKGLFITDKGIESYTNRKYYNIFINVFLDYAKSFVQIFIPVFSLIIAYIALTIKLDSQKKQYEKELQEVKMILKQQQINIKELEEHKKTHYNLKTE